MSSMAKIVTNAIRNTYKTLIKQVVKDLGESIYIYSAPSVADCPNCHWDRASKTSKGIFDASFVTPVEIFSETISPISFTRGRCPVCKGDGRLFDYSPRIVRALVKWASSDSELEKTVVGDEGQAIVRTKIRASYYSLIRDCDYAIIDGVKCTLHTPPVYRGLGEQDELVVAYFQAVEVGKSVKE